MPLTPVQHAEVTCRSRDGRDVARILIVPSDGSPLAKLDPHEAYAHNEAEVQLVENGHYEYRLLTERAGLRVSCRPVFVAHRLQTGGGEHGTIDTASCCGQLRVEIVHAATQDVVGVGAVEARSVKLGYRDDWRWMLTDIAGRMPGLLFDARVPAQMPLTPMWPRDAALLQQQVAFLCETLDSAEFRAAVQRILASPHQQLQHDEVVQPIQRAFRTGRDVERRLAQGNQRLALQPSHPLAQRLSSVPGRVAVPIKHTSHDTRENQFVKHALHTFADCLGHADVVLRRQGGAWQAIAGRARRAANEVERWLSHAFFRDVSPLRLIPIGSHVLQRKAGYRDVLQAWLRFHAGARLRWNAGDDLFRAGRRNVATLYEYWLFFQLLDWFCARFEVEHPPASMLLTRDAQGATLNLRQGLSVGPFDGERDGLRAQFCYNRMFDVAASDGSWTRPMQPDFTISFWRGDAPQSPTHLHFDAKYRVNTLVNVFAEVADDDVGVNNANRDDLVKMHAYRDAIRNTAGAYVLYPGKAAPLLLRRDDGTLPGLGAFAVAPGEGGRARGMNDVAAFLDEAMMRL